MPTCVFEQFSPIMPNCPYCPYNRYVTDCPSHRLHVENCRLDHERKREIEALRRQVNQQRPQQVQINNYVFIQNNYSQTLYLDYPKNDFTNRVLSTVGQLDVKAIRTLKDFQQTMDDIQCSENNTLRRCMVREQKDLRLKSQAYSFMATVAQAIRMRMQNETPFNTKVIGSAEQFEEDCLNDKQKLLGP